MDLQTTPPKRVRFQTPERQQYSTPLRNQQDFSTPPRKNEDYSTPYKQMLAVATPKKQSQTPQKEVIRVSTPHRPNPQSKRNHRSHIKPASPMCDQSQEIEVSCFQLSRLEQDYSLIKMLGSGNFSQVGLYSSRMTGQYFAIKQTRANRMSINQVQALGSLWAVVGQSPNVIRYYHSWVQQGQLYLVMQYCQGNLTRMIQKQRQAGRYIPQKVIKNLLKSALEGLKSLHRCGIIHLDIKPDNLLLKQDVLKIADFGLSRAAKVKSGQVEEGDSRYLALEVLNYTQGVDLSKSDIFSLAMTFYELTTLQHMPNNGQEWIRVRDQGLNLHQRMSQYSQQLLKILEIMGKKQWWLRPSAAQILQNNYFKQSHRKHGLLVDISAKKKNRESSL